MAILPGSERGRGRGGMAASSWPCLCAQGQQALRITLETCPRRRGHGTCAQVSKPKTQDLRPKGRSRHWSLVFGFWSLAFGLWCSGCTAVRYRVADLPQQYSAPPVVNVEAIELAGLAGPGESFDVIQRGDVLEVTMVTDFTKLTTTTSPVRVGDDGAASVPLIGPVRVAGATAEVAERLIAAEGQARGIFRTPCVTVTMKDQRKNKVLVVGAVKKPGAYELPRGSSSLLSALVAAEGLSKEAGMEVEIRRGAVGPRPGELPGGGPHLASYAPADGPTVSYREALGRYSPRLNAGQGESRRGGPVRPGVVLHASRRRRGPRRQADAQGGLRAGPGP